MGYITVDVPEDNGDERVGNWTDCKQSGGYVVKFVMFAFAG